MLPVLAAFCALLGPEMGLGAVSPGLSIVSGNGQVVREQFRTTSAMVFVARDAAGNPAPNLPITWKITQGLGTLVSSDTNTDGTGSGSTYFVATDLSAGLSFAPQTITATTSLGSVSFVVTTVLGKNFAPPPIALLLAPPQTNQSLSGKQGSMIAGAIQIQVGAASGVQQGLPIANVGVRLVDGLNPTGPAPAACTNAPLTDARGIATCDVVLTGLPGQYFLAAEVGEFVITPNIALTISPGTACAFALSPASANVAAGGATLSVNITSTQSCSWTAASTVAWISLTSAASGVGNGSLSLNVAQNNGTARTGVLTIAGIPFTVTQSAVAGASLAITTGANLPAAAVGSNYSIVIAASNGRPPYTFAPTGTLPPGLTLVASTGLLNGVPATAGMYNFGISVSDSAGASASQAFVLNVDQTTPGFNPAITNASFPNGTPGAAYSQLLMSVGGCTSPFSNPPAFSVVSGALPPGLVINALPDRTSVIAGTPTTNGTYTFTLKVTDVCARSGTGTFTITVGSGGGGGGGGGGSLLLSASTAQLTFSIPVGTTAPVTQVVNINATSGAGQFAALAQMSSASSLNWLSVTPAAGSPPASLSVTVSPALLPSGTFTGYVSLSPTGGSTGPQVVISVTVRVTPPPAFQIGPPSLLFLYQQGTPPSGTQLLTVGSAGAPFDFTTAVATDSGDNWLFVTPGRGTAPGTLSVSVNPLGLAAGTYKGTITLRSVGPGISPSIVIVTLTITQTAPMITSISNAASFIAGPVAPGELVTVFGTLLGPGIAQSSQLNASGLVDTAVGGTRVLFDGNPAPLIYISATQVSAIVPYELQGRTSTSLVVEYKGTRSGEYPVRVTDSAPGIFAGAGGQAAALNQDGSVNSSAAGADPGSVIALYATGEGFTDPAVVNGRIMGDILAKPTLPVSVQVNGEDAVVEYAGSAPGFPAGVMQVNVRLPGDLSHGAAVPVILTVGKAASQSGVTVYIR